MQHVSVYFHRGESQWSELFEDVARFHCPYKLRGYGNGDLVSKTYNPMHAMMPILQTVLAIHHVVNSMLKNRSCQGIAIVTESRKHA